jgi:hypothetical protein
LPTMDVLIFRRRNIPKFANELLFKLFKQYEYYKY